jgi:folate-binding Fe-S cluster repair protein YgfZ
MIEATKNNCIDLSDLGLLQVTGKHAKQFLQGQLTCNLEEVNEHQTRLGAHCDVKGRVQATFRLFFYQNA